MNRRLSLPVLLLGALALMLCPGTMRAQSASQLIDGARARLEDIQPDTAAVLLVRALDRRTGPTTTEQTRGWGSSASPS